MSWKRQIAKLLGVIRRRELERDVQDEMRAHLAMEEQENVQSGMSPEEAHYAALRRFGNVTSAQERSREMWAWASIEAFWQDFVTV